MRAGDERRRETGVGRARACAWLAMRCWAARAGQGSPRCVLRRRALGVPAACTTVLRGCAGAPAGVPGGRLQCCCVAYASLCSVRALQVVRVHSSSAARRAGVGHPCRGRGRQDPRAQGENGGRWEARTDLPSTERRLPAAGVVQAARPSDGGASRRHCGGRAVAQLF